MNKLESKINAVVEQAINTGSIVGTHIIVAQDGNTIFEKQMGFADRETQKPITAKTLFRLASMTKPLVSVAALALFEQGKLPLDTPITQWLPHFKPKLPNGENAKITMRHLLTHTSGLGYGFFLIDKEVYAKEAISNGFDDKMISIEENLKRLARAPLFFEPDSAWLYSLGIDVVGAILEVICQKPLPAIIEHYVTAPLGMADTEFKPKSMEHLSRAYADNHQPGGVARIMQSSDYVLSPLEACPVYYAPDRFMNNFAYPSGGAGMIGSAYDYLKFLEAIRLGGKPILKNSSTELLTTDAIKHININSMPGTGFSLGFAIIRDSKLAMTPRHVGSYGWGGAYGTSMFVDPAINLSAVVLTNTGLEGINGVFPVNITQAIYEALL